MQACLLCQEDVFENENGSSCQSLNYEVFLNQEEVNVLHGRCKCYVVHAKVSCLAEIVNI